MTRWAGSESVDFQNAMHIQFVVDPLGRRVGRKVNDVFTHRRLYESGLWIAAS